MPRKKKFGPWRMYRKDPLYKFEVFPGNSREMYGIRGVYNIRYRRRVYCGKETFEERKEEYRTVTLGEVFQCLRVSDRHASLVELTTSGLEVVGKLFERYEWYRRVKEEKDKRKRRLAYLAKKREREERQASEERSRRVKHHVPSRFVEV